MATTVLVVGANAGFRSMARRLLNASGFQVVGEAVDGSGAVAASLSLTPHVVLLNLELPDADGLSVAKELTSRDDSPAVYLVSRQEASAFGSRIAESGARGVIPRARLSPRGLATIIGRAR